MRLEVEHTVCKERPPASICRSPCGLVCSPSCLRNPGSPQLFYYDLAVLSQGIVNIGGEFIVLIFNN